MRKHDVEMLFDIYTEASTLSDELAQSIIDKVSIKVEGYDKEISNIFKGYAKGKKTKREAWIELDDIFGENFVYSTYFYVAPQTCECGEYNPGINGLMNEEMHFRGQCSNCNKELYTVIQNGVFDKEQAKKMKEDGFS